MSSQFDEIIDRRHTFSEKYDDYESFGKPQDAMPLWVADMDFRSPPSVREALQQLVQRGVFGYSRVDETYFAPIQDWYRTRFGWEPQYQWLVCTPGVVYGFSAALQALTEEGDGVMIQEPVYPPFRGAVQANGRRVVNSPLREENGRYQMEPPEEMERRMVENHVKAFLLCSPHNPVGRVWTREELLTIGRLCQKHGIYVICDEIHGDFVFPGHKHHVFASLNPQFASFTVTCTAPSKTFNLAGLQTSNLFVPNPEIRERLRRVLGRLHYEQPNLAGLTACMAAYQGGAPWLEELLLYLQGNVAFTREFLRENLPQLRFPEPEGTYLLWMDFRALGMEEKELDHFLTHKAKLWLNMGGSFGEAGRGFARMNIGCPRSVLEKALRQLKDAIG